MFNFKEYFQDDCPVMKYIVKPLILLAFVLCVYNVFALIWNDGVYRYYRYKIQSGHLNSLTVEEYREFKDREDKLYLRNALQN